MTGVSMRTNTNDVVHREGGGESPIGNAEKDSAQMKPVELDDGSSDVKSQRPQVQNLVDSNTEPNSLPQSAPVQEALNVKKVNRASGARRTRTKTGVRSRTGTNELIHRETETNYDSEMNGGPQTKPLDPDDGRRVVPSSTPQEPKRSEEKHKDELGHDSGSLQQAPLISKGSARNLTKSRSSSLRKLSVDSIREGTEDEHDDDVPHDSGSQEIRAVVQIQSHVRGVLGRRPGPLIGKSHGRGWSKSRSSSAREPSVESIREGTEEEHDDDVPHDSGSQEIRAVVQIQSHVRGVLGRRPGPLIGKSRGRGWSKSRSSSTRESSVESIIEEGPEDEHKNRRSGGHLQRREEEGGGRGAASSGGGAGFAAIVITAVVIKLATDPPRV